MHSEQISLLQGAALVADTTSSADSPSQNTETQPVVEKPRRGRPRKTLPKEAEPAATQTPEEAAKKPAPKKARALRARTSPSTEAGADDTQPPVKKTGRRRAVKASQPPLLEVAESAVPAEAIPAAVQTKVDLAEAQPMPFESHAPAHEAQPMAVPAEAQPAPVLAAAHGEPALTEQAIPFVDEQAAALPVHMPAEQPDQPQERDEQIIIADALQADESPAAPVVAAPEQAEPQSTSSPVGEELPQPKLSPRAAFEAAFFAEQRAAHAAALREAEAEAAALASAHKAQPSTVFVQDSVNPQAEQQQGMQEDSVQAEKPMPSLTVPAPKTNTAPSAAEESQPLATEMSMPKEQAEQGQGAAQAQDSPEAISTVIALEEADGASTTANAAPTVEAETKAGTGAEASALAEVSTDAATSADAAGITSEATAAEGDAEPEEGADAAEGMSEEDAEAQRKSRRGRRGGRSRKRKNKSLMHPVAELLDVEASPEQAAEAEPLPRLAADEEHDDLDDDFDDEELLDEDRPVKRGKRKMFISVLPSEQVEVTIVDEGVVSEYYLEMQHQAKIKGNIYKAIVHNIDTNLQAAFVNYGAGKNGFLQIDEVHPEYYLAHHEPMKGRKYPPIQKVLKAGQEVLVQVVKEPNGSKGAFLTTWLSLAGRFLVLTPGQEQIGVSRKVENDEERSRLREMMNGIEPGEGLGVIVRTVSAGTSKTTLKNDLQYLKRVWKDIRKRGTADTAPCPIYQEPGLAERAVRDYLTDDVNEIWVDNAAVAEAIRETASLLFPRKADLVKVHADARQGMWERFGLQRQLEQIYSREVVLPSGGRLVFDQTEALLAIDINSGKISGKTNFEAMAHRTNMEAAEAIARQLKLRDVGGQVVIDFIEMRDKNHIRDVEKTLRIAMKNDRARHDVNRMSSFGLLELVRQRTGSSALAITMEPCPHCGGTGLRRNMEWQALQALRDIRRMIVGGRDEPCVYQTTAEVGMYLLNNKRKSLQLMEENSGKTIEISIRP